MPIQKINNVHFNYELLGRKKDSPPIILISGYTCNIDFWRVIAENLSKNNPVLIFDNQGIGKTTDDFLPLAVESMAENVEALFLKLELHNPIIGGFALGGAIAQRIAYNNLMNVKKLILLSSVLKFSDTAKNICEKLYLFRENENLDSYSDLIYETTFSTHYKTKMSSEIFKNNFIPLLKNSQTAKDQRRQLEALKTFDSTSWAKDIKIPTLIINPNEDLFSTVEESEQLARSIHSGGAIVEQVIIKNCAHSILTEKPEEIVYLFHSQIKL